MFLYHYGASMHHMSHQGIQKNCASEFPILLALKLPLCKLVVVADMNTCILTEARNFKTFVKGNYAGPILCVSISRSRTKKMCPLKMKKKYLFFLENEKLVTLFLLGDAAFFF